MGLIKRVMAMSIVTALTFTSIELPVNATEYTSTQSQVVTEVKAGVDNDEAAIKIKSADTLTDANQVEIVQSTEASKEETTQDVPAATDQIEVAIPTNDSTVTENTTIEDKITAEDISISDKVAEDISTSDKMPENISTSEKMPEDISTSDKETEEISDLQKMIHTALLEKGTITLSEDLSIDEMLELKLPDSLEKAELTIMMNGHKITSQKAQAIMHVAENITLTIKGEGSIINNAEKGSVVYNEGIVNLDNADLLATGSKSIGVLNNNTLGEKGLVIKSGTIKAEWFAIGKTVKKDLSINRPTVFFAAAGIAPASTTTVEDSANIEQGSYSVIEDATVVSESADRIEVSNEKSTIEESTITQDATVQPEVSSVQPSPDADITTIPANQVIAVAPQVPVDVTTTVNSYNSIKIAWSSVADAQGYIIERMQSGTESTYTELANITGTEYYDTSLAVGKEYKYRVYTYLYTESSEMLKSSASSEVIGQTSLVEPQSLTGVQASVTSIKLTWNAVEGAVNYKIYRAAKGQGYKLIKTQQDTSFTNAKLKTGTKYYYKITAVNADYESGFSNTVSLFAAAKSVTKLKAKSDVYNKITLTWKKASGVTKYDIYRSTNDTSNFKKIKTISSTKFTNTVKTGATYYYKIISYTNKAKGGESTIVSATAICSEPTNVKATSKSYTSAKITWKKTGGAGLYAIYRSTSKNSDYTLLTNVSNTKSSYTDKAVSPGIKYYYKLCAVSRNVEGKMSKVVSASIKPAPAVNTETPTSTQATVKSQAPAKNIVVVLDPGHGGSDPGAVYGSLREKDLALKTALYTKAELEKYSGVIVKMTRTTDIYIGLEQRTIIAKEYGADLFVSQHYNAGVSSANGAEVFVSSNGNYNSSSTRLGAQITSNLSGIGLKNRGVKTRISSSGVSDYYSVIRNSVKREFPGIIVEGGFISSPVDRVFLSTEAGIKSIGVATATGIAKYYGLSKK